MTDKVVVSSEQIGLDLSVLPWIETVVGGAFLAYVLATDSNNLEKIISGEINMNSYQAGVLLTLCQLRAWLPEELDATVGANVLRNRLATLGPNGRSVARDLHNHVCNDEDPPATEDEMQASLVILALDSYGAFLLPSDRDFILPDDRHSIEVSRLLINHPNNSSFMAAVKRDNILARAFSRRDDSHDQAYAAIFRNTGVGSALQLIVLAEILLGSAARHIDMPRASPSSFARQALRELQLVRDVFVGKPRTITARVGLMGVLLPSQDTRFSLPNGVVRAMTEDDRRYAPEHLRGQLTGTDSSGIQTVANYDGDLVLELDYPYKVRMQIQTADGTPAPFPQDMMVSSVMEEVVLRLRSSLMFAVEREQRVQIVSTWREFDDPFNKVSRTFSWNDPRQGTGIMPVQLTVQEVANWSDWYFRLDTPYVARIELAISRIMRALAERREPSDILIDSVIAWENLFGTKEGEPTFRISMCLAVLLEDYYDARAALKTRLSKIYALRSKVVHGSGNPKPDELPMCYEALDIAVRAVRILTTTRTDVLKFGNGADRSAALLLGATSFGNPDLHSVDDHGTHPKDCPRD